ncbi:MAG: DEAD/DEAH box helicase, partial [Pseudomonadota bacterium]|nr:DEAD/DEAH box helicase [Pseudomonadota bacterium]
MKKTIKLPETFNSWFCSRHWRPYRHQTEMLRAAKRGENVLLIAPTGGGKTLAGFLPSLVDLAENENDKGGLHTLYISPLKALAIDVRRNLEQPVRELGLDIRIETRTGDTPQHRRQSQRSNPPQILMTTPESLALMLSYSDAPSVFRSLKAVIIDELHALAGTKRGDLLALGLARLQHYADKCRRVALSATAAHPEELLDWLSPAGSCLVSPVRLIEAKGGRKPKISILSSKQR